MLSSALIRGFVQAEQKEYVSGFAGQISGLIHEIKPAREILLEMVEEAAEILTGKLRDEVTVQ